MARPRADTGSLPKEPHSLSLKVLRLARPSLAQQHPLPSDNVANIPQSMSLAYPASTADQEFMLSHNLSLPGTFGSAYVGETFSCSLCTNNELNEETASKTISDVRISAEMQMPSQQHVALRTSGAEPSPGAVLAYGASLQQIVRFDLKEEGNHVLIVNLTYTESPRSPETAAASPGSRVRSFRKLYQFQAQPCLNVRTKATELSGRAIADKNLGPYGRSMLARYVLEAQLENVSEGSIVLEQTKLIACPPFVATSLNWDMADKSAISEESPLLNTRDIQQLAFLVEQQPEVTDGLDELKTNLARDGRTALGQIALDWRSTMGETGHLTTGVLFSRKR